MKRKFTGQGSVKAKQEKKDTHKEGVGVDVSKNAKDIV